MPNGWNPRLEPTVRTNPATCCLSPRCLPSRGGVLTCQIPARSPASLHRPRLGATGPSSFSYPFSKTILPEHRSAWTLRCWIRAAARALTSLPGSRASARSSCSCRSWEILIQQNTLSFCQLYWMIWTPRVSACDSSVLEALAQRESLQL
jgi:hypothetical protein